MANIKYKLMYGQYTHAVAEQLSNDNLGAIVFSGKEKAIYIDGKCIAANFQGSVDTLREMIGELENLNIAIKGEDLVQTINNLKDYVDEKINEVLGDSDLEKTLDTIKEIQEELLKDSHYYVTKNKGEEDEARIEVFRQDDGTYIDAEGTLVATEDDSSDGFAYETGYSDLERENIIDTLLEGIAENRKDIEELESRGIVSDVDVDENENKDFVTATAEDNSGSDGISTQKITIGVNYGTFKTGKGDVLDPESNAYTDGIATVENVQNYIEERMIWDEFNTQDSQGIANDINNSSEDTYDVTDDNDLNDPFVIG